MNVMTDNQRLFLQCVWDHRDAGNYNRIVIDRQYRECSGGDAGQTTDAMIEWAVRGGYVSSAGAWGESTLLRLTREGRRAQSAPRK